MYRGTPLESRLPSIVRQDLRYALRTLAARPGFALVAAVSLALGIGANTAIFSLWNAVSRAALPGIDKPERLVILTNPRATGSWHGLLTTKSDGPRPWITYEEFEQLRAPSSSFSGVMASQSVLNTPEVRIGGGVAEEARVRLVSAEFFDVLGVRPVAGRFFATADERVPVVAVVSHAYWQRRLGGRADAIGQTVAFPDVSVTIVGVAPAGFIGETAGQQPDLWLPIQIQPLLSPGEDWLRDQPPDKVMWLHAFGRLRPGVTIAQAQSEVDGVFQRGLEAFYGATSPERRSELLDQRLLLGPGTRGVSSALDQFSSSVNVLFVAVALLLLIGCANLANLLLSRGVARHGELAIRLSLGASRGRLVRQLLAESLALSSLGGVGAMLVAYAMHALLVQLLRQADPNVALVFDIDLPITLFVAAASIATALTVGVIPALHMTNGRTGVGLESITRGSIGSPGESRSTGWLVGVQVALALPMLVATGLLVRTADNLLTPELGYRTERLMLARVRISPLADDARRSRAMSALHERARGFPGVDAVTFSQLGLFDGGRSTNDIAVEGSPVTAGGAQESAFDRVGPGYFTTLGVPLRLGRDIGERDTASSPFVCVVNEAFVAHFLPGASPLGRHVTVGGPNAGIRYQITGVVADARTETLRDQVVPRFFVPAAQHRSSSTNRTILIRSRADSASLSAVLQSEAASIDPALTVQRVRPLSEHLADLTAEDRAVARLSLAFGLSALALASIGLYGVLSYRVTRRAREIAMRVALGALPHRVVAMVMTQAAGVVLGGLAVGTAIAVGASRLMVARLYGVSPRDLTVFAGAVGVLMIAAGIAAYLPARRAARIDPMRVLHRA
jgi:predicted permease